MDKRELQARAEKRRTLAQAPTATPAKSLTEEIGEYWLKLAVEKWDPATQKEVPEGVPVGKEALTRFVDDYLRRSGFRTREWDIASTGAEEVARWIDHHGNRVVGRDYPNPLSGVTKDKGKGSGFVVASIKTAKSIYDGKECCPDRYKNMYAKPEEHCRTCPEHAGIQMRRVSDGVYQCPIAGDTFSYTGGHEVKYEMGVQNQTNLGWNKTWSQAAFLTTPNQQSQEHKSLKELGVEKSTKFEEKTEDLYAKASRRVAQTPPPAPICGLCGQPLELVDEDDEMWLFHCGTPACKRLAELGDDLYNEEGQAVIEKPEKKIDRNEMQPGEDSTSWFQRMMRGKSKGFTKSAKVVVDDKVFGTPQVQTRYCPDHAGVSLARVADKVYQCPMDRAVYDFEQGFVTQDGKKNLGGSVSEMTPDRPGYYNSGNAFISATSRGFTKRACDQIPGGLSDNKPDDQFDTEQVEKGVKVEMEHTNDKDKAREIAKDHLAENEDYYKKLDIMEETPLKEMEKKESSKSLAKKAFGDREQQFVFDLSHFLRTKDAEAQKVVELVIHNVIRKGLRLAEAIGAAYDYMEQQAEVDKKSAIQQQPPQELEVTEEDIGLPGMPDVK